MLIGPEEFRAVPINEKSGKKDYLYIGDLQGLVAAVQMGALELHLWGSRADGVEKPDRMVFDLDPDEEVNYAQVKPAANGLRDRLKKLVLKSFPIITGGKGVHVVVPLTRGHSWDDHRDFAEAIARIMAEEEPDRFIANMSKAKRMGKILVDYLRNTGGATAIAPYSVPARKGAPFAAPLTWDALAKLKNAHAYTVGDTLRGDSWKDYFKVKQALPLGRSRR